ncbi:MAG TPA: hypothetical protein VEA16_10580 [Vicinamibacterales bacterium]|nr:hypothetical protein [Vicinamibacterales bacterium]
MTISSRALAGALALVFIVPAAVTAQTRRNPFTDLFGRSPDRTGREFTSVQLRSEAGAQWGTTLKEEFLEPGTRLPDGLAAGADLSMIGYYVRDRVQMRGQGRYSYQEYRQPQAFGAPAYDGGGHVNLQATTRLSFQGGGRFTRSPFYHLVWLAPEQFAPMQPVDRAAIVMMENDTIEGSAGATSNYTKRSSLSITGHVRETRFARRPQFDLSSRGARGQWKRQLTRDMAVRAGYGREEMRHRPEGVERLFVNEIFDVGVDYAQALSLARRTTFSFATETSMVRENAGPKRFRINGHVMLERHFQRTWIAQLSGHRTTEFLPGFRSPVFTERAQASLAGYLAPRLLLNMNASGGQGQAGFSDPRKFISYQGDAKVTVAVTRHLGVFTQYVYHHFQSPPDPQAMFAFPRVARQAVSVGVQTWISLIDKDKVTSDPR